jgi:hypothetical protein
MTKVEVVSIEPTGTFSDDLELLKVTLKRDAVQVTCSGVLYWDNGELLGLEGTFDEFLEFAANGDSEYSLEA